MTELLLVRHALPLAGVVHPGLGDEGRRQGELLGRWLAAEPVDALVSSPLRRAQETAALVAEGISRPVDAVVDDLREWDTDVAARAYTPIEQMASADPRAIAVAEGRYDDFVPELDLPAFRQRAADCLDELFTRWPSGRVVAVCHGGIINAMVGSVLGIPSVFWFNPGYTSVSRLERLASGRTVVRSVNETAHLHAVRASPADLAA